MKFRGQQGLSAEVAANGKPITVLDAQADESTLATILLRAERPDARPAAPGSTIACVADIEFGGEGVGHSLSCDIMNGVAITLAAKRWRVSVRNTGTLTMKVNASIAEGVRPAARELQLTTYGAAIIASQSAEFAVPNFAAWLEIERANEEGTEFAIDFGDPNTVAVYRRYVLQGKRGGRFPIANGITRVTVRNPIEDAGNQTITPTLIWGLWL